MTRLPGLHRELVRAARRDEAQADNDARSDAPPARGGDRWRDRRTPPPVEERGVGRPPWRRGRLLGALVLGLVVTTTAALAAGGVILVGRPVRPAQRLTPDAGLGVPAKGRSVLLPLRAPDPSGGLPWGMRLVHTTRGELCIQIGRVYKGALGELGVDGAFHDDGRFHPLPANALPEYRHGGAYQASETTRCMLSGKATAGEYLGVDRSAASISSLRSLPGGDLRDVYYGLLGKEARSITYRATGGAVRSRAVERGVGAYLIVEPGGAKRARGYGAAALGTRGMLAPSLPITAITYDLGGRLCERFPARPPGTKVPIAGKCPIPHFHSSATAHEVDLHEPIKVKLRVRERVVTAATVSFKAPHAVASAHHNYTVLISLARCHRGNVGGARSGPREAFSGYAIGTIDRDVKAGETLTRRFAYPFSGACGRKSVAFVVLYEGGEGGGRVVVGRARVDQPRGTIASPSGKAPRRRWGPLAPRSTLER